MKAIRHIILPIFATFALLLAGCSTATDGVQETANAEEAEKFAGIWIGKWDGHWPVEFTIRPDLDGGTLFYVWKENIDGPWQRRVFQGLTIRDGKLHFRRIIIEIDPNNPNKALASGDFPTPRAAQLTRTNSPISQ